jgi:PAS domain S-box-containing protein
MSAAAHVATLSSRRSDRARALWLHRTNSALADIAPSLDRTARLVAQSLSAPVALISFADDKNLLVRGRHAADRRWQEVDSVPLRISLCGQVIRSKKCLAVADLRLDKRFADLDIVISGMALAYIGMPLFNRGGICIGSLCAIDFAVRDWSDVSLKSMSDFAALASEQIESRLIRVPLVPVREARLQALEFDWDTAPSSVLVDRLTQGICVFGGDGAIRAVNPALCQMCGFTAEELIGKPLQNFVVNSKERWPYLRKSICGEIASQGRWYGEVTERRKDGQQITYFAVIGPLPIGAGGLWIAVLFDISARKKIEAATLEVLRQEQLHVGARLHDGLGQHLSGIAMMLSRVESDERRRGGDGEQLREVRQLVDQAIESCRTMAQRLTSYVVRTTGFAAALEAVVGNFESDYEIRCELTIDRVAALDLNAEQSQQLVRIAEEALENVGRRSAAKFVTVTFVPEFNGLELTISDDGCGLRNESQLDDSLGQQVMKFRAESILGTLSIDARPDQGTTVRCRLTKTKVIPEGSNK